MCCRLAATVIHELWTRDDRSLVIMPGMIPLDAPRTKDELLRYLPETWNAVVDSDVDGAHSEPRTIDSSNARFGSLLAARRVARTVFLGSAAHVRQQSVRGIEDVRVRLGVVQPGEPIAVFNDALGRLVDKLTYLYSGNRRYWYDTQPNLRRTMEERAGKLDEGDDVVPEMARRLQGNRERGDFKGVHIFRPSADVPDEPEARLVVLPPSASQRGQRQDSAAIAAAAEILDKHGNGPRTHRNMLLFLAADADQVPALQQEVRHYLAWKSIVEDADTLNLDAHQRREAAKGEERSNDVVTTRLNETYAWLLTPTQEGTGPLVWELTSVRGAQESPVAKAAKKARGDHRVITQWSPVLLRMELDRWLWKDNPHISLKRVWEVLTTYLYMSRLRDEDVFMSAVREGLRTRDYFAYATSIGPDGRYQGLRLGNGSGSIHLDGQSVLVKPDVAAKQLATEVPPAEVATATYPPTSPGGGTSIRNGADSTIATPPVEATAARPKRFHGSVQLDPMRVNRDASQVAQEVIQHLTSVIGAQVEVTLEIHTVMPDGAPDQVVRTVTENCRTLKFTSHGFENE